MPYQVVEKGLTKDQARSIVLRSAMRHGNPTPSDDQLEHSIGRLLAAQTHANFCRVYARRTPMIPFHNGSETCIGCGKPIVRVRRTTGADGARYAAE